MGNICSMMECYYNTKQDDIDDNTVHACYIDHIYESPTHNFTLKESLNSNKSDNSDYFTV